MTINEILNCYNHILNKDKIYVAYSKWEKKFGPIKTAYVTIAVRDLKNLNNSPEEPIKTEFTGSVPAGQEYILMEKAQKLALIEFIKRWNNDTGIK